MHCSLSFEGCFLLYPAVICSCCCFCCCCCCWWWWCRYAHSLSRAPWPEESERSVWCVPACVYVCVRSLALALTDATLSLSLILISLSFFYPNYQRRLAFTCLYFGITFTPPCCFPNSNSCQKMAPHFYLPAELMEKSWKLSSHRVKLPVNFPFVMPPCLSAPSATYAITLLQLLTYSVSAFRNVARFLVYFCFAWHLKFLIYDTTKFFGSNEMEKNRSKAERTKYSISKCNIINCKWMKCEFVLTPISYRIVYSLSYSNQMSNRS